MLKIARFSHKIPQSENNRLFTSFNSRNRIAHFNYLHPSEILTCKWGNNDEFDEIMFRSHNGNIHTVSDDHLLEDITGYMRKNGLKGTLPYIHIEGKLSLQCYEQPKNEHIISYLRKYFNYYDIYDKDDNLVKRAIKTNRTIIISYNDESE
jgi:hypothetical protein